MTTSCHRIIGFIILLISTIANIAVFFTFSDLIALPIFILSILYFGIFTYYTYLFLCIKHYTDTESKHISINYIKLINASQQNIIRIILLILYYAIFLSSYTFPAYLPHYYAILSPYQKTMFTYNYTMTSFTIMYIYQHKIMNKYLSLGNVNIYDNNNSLVNYDTILEDR